VKNSVFPPESNNVVVLDELARRVRDARKAAQEAGATVLHRYLDAGDALNEAQKRVTTGWKKWLKQDCSLSVRTAFLYQQLANHRAEIEVHAATEQAGDLSLRAAVRLISKPRSAQPRDGDLSGRGGDGLEEPAPELTDEQVLAALTAANRGVGWFIANMPAGWREVLQARLRGPILRAEQRAHPNTRLKNLNLRLVSSTDRPTQH
jgi:hypothetical protein